MFSMKQKRFKTTDSAYNFKSDTLLSTLGVETTCHTLVFLVERLVVLLRIIYVESNAGNCIQPTSITMTEWRNPSVMRVANMPARPKARTHVRDRSNTSAYKTAENHVFECLF